MKKMRIPLLIALGVAIVGIVLGSFFDLEISKAIASPNNTFGLIVSAVAPTFGFATVACMGGGFIALAIKGEYNKWLKVLFYVLASCCLGVAIYYPGGEYFGVNGFYKTAPEWVGYLIVIIPEGAAMYGGYVLFKDCQNKNIWIVFCIVIALLLIALLGIIPMIKDNMHRPRYRFISNADNVPFYNWWEACTNYKELITRYQTHKDNFKSFPSGHTAETCILFVGITFFPMANKKFEKYQLSAFVLAAMFTLLLMTCRILAAAHYLSDVSWGATIMLALTLIANEIVIHIKALHIPEEEIAKE